MVNYAYEIGGVDFSGLVERDSYSTSLEPVYSEEIETMNRKRHFVLVRNRGTVTVKLNPQTEEDIARFCAAVLAGPVMVRSLSSKVVSIAQNAVSLKAGKQYSG